MPLVIDFNDNGRQVRYFIPAARISPTAGVSGAPTGDGEQR